MEFWRSLFWGTPKYTGPERRKKPRWRPRPLRVLGMLLGLALMGYAAAVVWLMRQETRLVLQAVQTLGDTRPPFPYQHIDIPRADGERQFAWLMRDGNEDKGPWVVYLHGNPSTIASPVSISHYQLFRKLGLNVFAPEYRGFGGLGDRATTSTLQADADAAYHYLRDARRIPSESIIVYGWSFGSAVAVDMASRTPPRALILEGAPASLLDLSRKRYPLFPLRFFMRSSFDSIRRIGDVPSPMLFLHSAGDEVIPITDGRRLFDAARSAKMFVEVPGSHMTAVDDGAAEFETAIREFLRREGVVPERDGTR
jgi:pimeloyl-ACP methyl ester carboxylesterase